MREEKGVTELENGVFLTNPKLSSIDDELINMLFTCYAIDSQGSSFEKITKSFRRTQFRLCDA
jgi:hypothetical protein